MVPIILLALLLVSVLLPGPGAGSPSRHLSASTPSLLEPRWNNETSSGPASRSNASAAWATGGSYAVLFGGSGSCGTYCNDTWIFQDSPQVSWTQEPAGSGPRGREGAAMTWDPLLGSALLFGGSDGASLNGTWSFNRADGWSRMAVPGSPPARSGAAMAYDAATGQVILFGGEGAGGLALGDTWAFGNGTWHQLFPAVHPSPRWGAAMTYDAATGAVDLFGGRNASAWDSGLWQFQNGSWSLLARGGAGTPAPREGASLVSSADGTLFLFGGAGSLGPRNDSWQYANGTWTPVQGAGPTGTPGPLAGMDMVPAPDLGPNLFWMFGGWPLRGSELTAWTLYLQNGGTLGNLRVAILPGTANGTAPFTVDFTASIQGGFPPYEATWDFGDGTPNATGLQVNHTFSAAAVDIVGLTVVDAKGDRATAQAIVTVLAAPPPPPPETVGSFLTSPPGEALLGSLVALALVGLGVREILRRRRFLRGWEEATGGARPSLGRDVRRLVRTLREGGRLRELGPALLRLLRSRRPAPGTQALPNRRGTGRALATYALRRGLTAVGQLFLVMAIIYLLGTVLPAALGGTSASPSGGFLPASMDYFRQFLTFVANLLTGNWGYTSAGGKGVPGAVLPWTQFVLYHFPPSLELGGLAFLLSMLLAYPVGLVAGWHRGRSTDHASRILTLVGLFLPVFILVLVVVGYLYYPYFITFGTPPFGDFPQAPWFDANMGGIPPWIGIADNTVPTGFPLIDAALHGAWSLDLLLWLEVLLPASLLSLGFLGIFLRYLRLATADEKEAANLAHLRARGLGERTLLWHHTARRVLPTYVAVFGETFPVFVLVQAVTEVVFNFQGLGYDLLYETVNGFQPGLVVTNATPVGNILQVFLVILAALIIGVSALTDVVARALDPRLARVPDRRALPVLPRLRSPLRRRDGSRLPVPRGRGRRKLPLPALPPNLSPLPESLPDGVPPLRGRLGKSHGNPAASLPAPRRARFRESLRAWWTRPTLALGSAILLFFVGVALYAVVAFGSTLSTLTPDPDVYLYALPPSPPTLSLVPWSPGPHPLGETALLGFDVLHGLVKGTPWDLLTLVEVLLPTAALGFGLGGVAGLFGGRIDEGLMAVTDAFLSIPAFVLVALVAVELFQGGIPGLSPSLRPDAFLGSMVAVLWAPFARSVRARARVVATESYVEAARASGAGPAHLLRRHVLPNSFTPVLSQIPITASTVIFLLAMFQYAGLELGSPMNSTLLGPFNFPEWTWILSLGAWGWQPPQSGLDPWWGYVFPALWILLFGLGLILVADGLRDHLSPRRG